MDRGPQALKTPTTYKRGAGPRQIRVCQCAPGGTVNVQGPDYGRTFGRGAEVDFSERVAPHVDLTWGQALDRYAHLFAAPGVDASAAPPNQQSVVEGEGN